MRTLLILPLLLAASAAMAQDKSDKDKVYRWTDSHGVVHYTDAPPQKDAKPVKLPPLQTYAPGKAPPGAPALVDTPAAPAPVHTQVRVVSPMQGEVFGVDATSVTVAAVIEAGGENAKGMMLYLDGKPATSQPMSGNSFTFSPLDRGEHTATAEVIGDKGVVLARSAPVTFVKQQPSLLNKPKTPAKK